MKRQHAIWCAASIALASCSLLTDSKSPRLVSASIVLTNALRSTSARPPGKFASVMDSVVLTVKSASGEVLARVGYKLRAYDSTATLSVDIPPGPATFDVQVLSNNRTVVFTGSTPATVADDGTPVSVSLAPVRPVLLVLPDTANTTISTGTLYTIYNAGNSALSPSIASMDTALTRCGVACTIALGAGSIAPGQTATLRASVPSNFPSRQFSLVLRSAEGDVPVYWNYAASSVTSVTVQPTTALLTIGQTTLFTASVQGTGTPPVTVTWSSANTSLVIVGVDANGGVAPPGTALAVGRGLTNVVARSTVDTTKSGVAAVRVYDSTVTAPNWTISFPRPQDTITINRDAVNQATSSVNITAQATGPGGVYQNPFTIVEFWARPFVGGSWRRIGQTAATSLTDNGQVRTYAWTITWNPDATDAPFANPSSTRMAVIAIGVPVASTAQATTTPANSRITVVVP